MRHTYVTRGRTALAIAFLAGLAMPANAGAPDDVDDEVAAILAIEGDPAFGGYLAGECATCHRPSGSSDGIPAIAGLDAEAFVTAMVEYRTGVRTNAVMTTTAERLAPEDIAALAAHFSSLDAP